MSQVNDRVYVIEDDDMLRLRLELIVESIGLTTRSYPNPCRFLEQYSPEMRGCVVSDVVMPEMSGLELLRRLNELEASMPLILMSAHGEISMAVEALREGAFHFLEKPLKDDLLLETIQKALALEGRNHEEMAEVQQLRKRLTGLTPREKEVMYLMADGSSNKMIAQHLGIARRTVETHRARVLEKMDAMSAVHLSRMVMTLQNKDKPQAMPGRPA